MGKPTAVGEAVIAKDMAIRCVDDAISIVSLRERDGVLPTDVVRRYVKERIKSARHEIDLLEKALIGGA